MCAPYFVNLNNNTFWLKRYYSLFIYVHSKRKQKSHLQLSNLQCCHFDIVILRVAIISNVQNVRLQRRHRPTDDASTCRWRGSQQTGPVRTTRRSDAHAARRRPHNKKVNACPVLYISPGFGTANIIKIGSDLTELQSNIYCYVL